MIKLKSIYEYIIQSREDMPQINDIEGALDLLKDRGIEYVKDRVKPSELKASQHDFTKSKVDKFAKTITPKNMKPLVISLDNYIVDGHHRWKGLIQAGYNNDKIPVYRIKLNQRQAIAAYKDISRKGI